MNPIERNTKRKKDSRNFELQVVAGCLLGRNIVEVYSNIPDKWFLNEDVRALYNLAKESFQNQEDITPKIKGIVKDVWLEANEAGTPLYGPESQANILKKNYVSFQLDTVVAEEYEKDITDAFQEISDLQSRLVDIVSETSSEDVEVGQVFEEFEKERSKFEEKKRNGQELIGYSTGYKKLDNVIDGLRPGHLWLLGGYTSSGKTTFALNIVRNLIRDKKRVSFFSLEMGKVDILRKIMALMVKVGPAYLTKAMLTAEESELYEKSKDELLDSGMKIHTKSHDLKDIILKMTAEKLKNSSDVFVIDYAQLVQSGSQNEYEAMSKVAMELQSFAQQNDIPIILISQVSNESAKSPESNIIGFKGSGALAASADIAIELISGEEDRDEKMRKFAEGESVRVNAVIKKNRHGRIGKIEFDFNTKYGLFEEADFFDDF